MAPIDRDASGNLHGIASASAMYTQANGGYLPYASYVRGGSWLSPSEPNVPIDSNTRHTYRLVTQRYVPDMKIFICPADKNGRPMAMDNAQQVQDFAQRCNNSYSYLFMNTPQGLRVEQLQPGMVLMGDCNPLAPSSSTPVHVVVQPDAKNSPVHYRGAGQNAVYADGHGGWFTSPTIGVDRGRYLPGRATRFLQGHRGPGHGHRHIPRSLREMNPRLLVCSSAMP